MTKYTELQPLEGECIVYCYHIRDTMGKPQEYHFYKTTIQFVRPDLTNGVATWMVLCKDCNTRLQSDSNWNPPIAGDSIWKGNAPFIKKAK